MNLWNFRGECMNMKMPGDTPGIGRVQSFGFLYFQTRSHRLAQCQIPRKLNRSTRKPYHRDGGDIYFRVTLSFFRRSNLEFSLAFDPRIRIQRPLYGALCFT